MTNLTPIQRDFAIWCHIYENGGKVPQPYITEDEFNRSVSGKPTVREFAESMQKSRGLMNIQQEDPNPELLRAGFEKKARENGMTNII
jgi:hypothetical protein